MARGRKTVADQVDAAPGLPHTQQHQPDRPRPPQTPFLGHRLPGHTHPPTPPQSR